MSRPRTGWLSSAAFARNAGGATIGRSAEERRFGPRRPVYEPQIKRTPARILARSLLIDTQVWVCSLIRPAKPNRSCPAIPSEDPEVAGRHLWPTRAGPRRLLCEPGGWRR